MGIIDSSKNLATEWGIEFESQSLRITSPGKFEGEWLPVLYFQDAYLNGMSDFCDDEHEFFRLTTAEMRELKTASKIAKLHTSDQGFVSLSFGRT